MGAVHRVLDKKLDKDVALKTLPEPTPEQLRELKQEFRSAASLSDPHLVELYELFAEGERCFFTMELLDGHDLVEHVRDASDGGGRLDLTRVTPLVPQLVHGLRAIHDAGLLHRDIKPSNAMVTSAGRLVLLDFGLATSRHGNPLAGGPSLTGTMDYMAPEQAWGTSSKASDWYAVGAMLYEALTGSVPFAGAPARMLAARQRGTPPPPSSVDPSIPEWLDTLVLRLLDPKPDRRPEASEILGGLMGPTVVHSAPDAPGELPFVGRERELAALREHASFTDTPVPRTVHVFGPSGMGKSTLIDRFVRTLEDDHAALVLRSRCHPQESLAYKALDGIIDDLSRVLARTDALDDGPLPERVAALLRLFPVLRSVPQLCEAAALTQASQEGDDEVEPVILRRHGARALRELLQRLSTGRRLVLWIDDLQWGDLDSAVLLRELLRPPDAPPMLLILSYRSEDIDSSPLLAELADDPLEARGVDRRSITVGTLTNDEVRELTGRMLEELGVTKPPVLGDIVPEAAGSPLFAVEIARHLASMGGSDGAKQGRELRLATVLDDRIESLEDEDRRILELASIAALPLSRELALEAAGIGPSGWHIVTRLERRALLRQRPGDESSTTVYHDRIGEAAIARLDAAVLQQRHEALADALERRPSPDPQALVVHSLGAGRTKEAGRYAATAAERAMDALAFDRAAELYGVALEHREGDGLKAELLVKRADALANAGRGGDSGGCYIDAANERAAHDADGWEVQRLRGLGAEQLIRSGRLDDGFAVQRKVLDQFGIAMPKSDQHALMQAAGRRLKLTLRGIGFVGRDADEVPKQVLRRLDALWSASTGMAMMNYAMADAFGTQHLIEALRAGERRRVAKALGYEAAFEAVFGVAFLTRRSRRKLALAQQIAEKTQQPYDRAWVAMSRSSAMWGSGCFRESREAGEQAYEIYSTRCRGVPWEMSVTQLFVLSSLAFVGDLVTLVPRLDAALRDAIDRGDLFAANNYRLGQMSIARLAQGRVDEALELAAHAKSTWPKTVYHTQHYHHAVLTVQAELYRRDPWKAFAAINGAIPGLKQAQIHFNQVPWAEILHLQARAAVDAARTLVHRGSVSGPTRPDPAWSTTRLLRLAKSTARTLDRGKTPMAKPFAASLRAAVAVLRHREIDAIIELERTLEGFDHAGMELYREATRRRLGELVRGDAGAAQRHQSGEWFAAQGVADPTAMTAMMMPGFASG